MTLSIKEIRELGFSKLISAYREANALENLEKAVNSGILAFGDVSITPFGMLSYYDSIKDLSPTEVRGILGLMGRSCTTSSLSEPERADKRKFAYYWEQLWKSFGESVEEFYPYASMLSILGMVLPIFLSAVEAKDEKAIRKMETCEFYLRGRDKVKQLRRVELELTLEDVHCLCGFFNAVEFWFLTTVKYSSYTTELLLALVDLDKTEFKRRLQCGEDLLIC